MRIGRWGSKCSKPLHDQTGYDNLSGHSFHQCDPIQSDRPQMCSILMTFILLAREVSGQYSELASFIGGSLTPGLLGTAAGHASKFLRDIGTMYQIAQGALQLTGTGVGILNQASEGKWFDKVVEESKNANREIQEKALIGNRLEPDYSQFGINFPAPAPSDYDHEDNTKEEILIPISANSIATENTAPTELPLITLFPEEKTENNLDGKENQNAMSVASGNRRETGSSRKKENTQQSDVNVLTSHDHEVKGTIKKLEGKAAKLQRFIALLLESNVTENDLSELTRLLERERTFESKANRSSTRSRILLNSSTGAIASEQHTNEASKASINASPMIFRDLKPSDGNDNEDSDLFPPTSSRPRARAVRIKYEPKKQIKIHSNFHRLRKYPRRTAYRARLPFEHKPNVTRQYFLQPDEQSKVYLNAPTSEVSRIPTFSLSPYSQAWSAVGNRQPYIH